VILGAFQFHNVHLMLLSGIGKPYDPVTGEGVVGRNFAYQNHDHHQGVLRQGRVYQPVHRRRR
jgi:choline dehydrogenase-like flavoprotein